MVQMIIQHNERKYYFIINAKKNVKLGGVLKLCLSDEKGLLHFSVYNQGDTIPNDKLKKIWIKFYRD